MTPSYSAKEISAYYASALAALRYLEHARPTGRRFGADADARWSSFRGDLTTADRIDLLIRDADAQWPEAFGARTVFAMRAVAEDESFGAEWVPLEPVDAEELWRTTIASEAATSPAAVLAAVARAWGHSLVEHDVEQIGPTDKIVVVGPSAIAAVLDAFRQGADLDWSTQVTLVATPPGHRQLGALSGGLLGVAKPTRILAAAAPAKPAAGARLILAHDGTADDVARAKELASP